MVEFLRTSLFFGVLVSIFSYWIGTLLKKKLKLAIFNPLLVAIVLTMLLVVLLRVDYESYYAGGQYLSYLMTPVTVCLAIPLYNQLQMLRRNWKAILAGIFAGALTSLLCVLVLALLFHMDHAGYVTLLPRSVTTAIGMPVAEELGGYSTIAAAVIIVTGIFGNIVADGVCRLFRIQEPVAKGVALGTSAHAIGTVRAMEMGETEGAMSSLAICVSGVMTVIGASIFAQFI